MLPDSITALIAALAKLPGVGPRSAERMALHLVQADPRRGEATGRDDPAGPGKNPVLHHLRRA